MRWQCGAASWAGMLYGFKTSFDDELARFSTGTLLELELFSLLGSGISMIDPCAAPDNEWLNGIYPERRPIRKLLIGVSAVGRGATAALPLYDGAALLRARVRNRSAGGLRPRAGGTAPSAEVTGQLAKVDEGRPTR